MTTVSQDLLAAELKSAYSQLQTANAQSLSTFLEKVASLSEAEFGDSHALVQNLRGLMPTGMNRQGLNVEDYTQAAGKHTIAGGCTDGTLWKSIPQHGSGQTRAPSLEAPVGENGLLAIVEEAHPYNKRASSVSHLKEDYGVSLLEFVSENGDVQHPSPAWSKIPGAKRIVKALIDGHWAKPVDKGVLFNIVHSQWFNVLSTIAIALNFLLIIAQTDVGVSNLNEDPPQAMRMIESMFTIFYVVELILSISAYRKDYFFGHDFAWNWFDFIIVSQDVIQKLMEAAGQAGTKTSFLRVIRFLRISKGLRMLHAMRTFKEIKIFFDALAGSFNLFIWCSIMLALYMCMFAIFFVQGITSWLETSGEDPNVDPQLVADIQTYFGSVSDAMLSLFSATFSGDDWSQYHNVLKQCGWTYSMMFLAYIAFSVIAFANTITGVYTEKAMSLAIPSLSELGQIRLDRDVGDAELLVNLLKKSLEDPTKRSIDRQDFARFLAHPDTGLYFAVRGLNTCSLDRFFHLLLELQHDEEVPFGQFVSACVRLNGSASCMDVYVLSAQIKRLQKEHHAFLVQNMGENHKQVYAKVDLIENSYARTAAPCVPDCGRSDTGSRSYPAVGSTSL